MSEADTEFELKKLCHETSKILEEGGFQLRKWATNFPEFLRNIFSVNVNEPVHFINKGEEICTLGMQWNVTKEFQYDINIFSTSKVTKRIMLSAFIQDIRPSGTIRTLNAHCQNINTKSLAIRFVVE